MTHWQRITEYIYRLDDVWTVRFEPGAQWRAYRREAATLVGFAAIQGAMAEAERLRKEDEGYR